MAGTKARLPAIRHGAEAAMQKPKPVPLYRFLPRRGGACRRPAMAGVTGLEPAASGVTGRRSNQLSYTPAAFGRGGHS
jgi:hypothetical protein